MTTPAVFIRKIWQVNNTQFAIHWTDGTEKLYTLSDLQRNCPCAACRENQGKEDRVPEDLTAIAVRSVGRYALRIDFNTGCSNGIFHFGLLYQLGTTPSTPLTEECCL